MEAVIDAPDDAATSFDQPRGVMARAQHVLHKYPTISPALVLLLSCIVFTIVGKGRFQRPETIGIILQQAAVLAALAIGQTLIILTAGVDLSVGAAMLLVHLVIAKMAVDQGVPPLLALLIGMVVGIALGSFQRLLGHQGRSAAVHRHPWHVLHLRRARPGVQPGADDLQGRPRW